MIERLPPCVLRFYKCSCFYDWALVSSSIPWSPRVLSAWTCENKRDNQSRLLMAQSLTHCQAQSISSYNGQEWCHWIEGERTQSELGKHYFLLSYLWATPGGADSPPAGFPKAGKATWPCQIHASQLYLLSKSNQGFIWTWHSCPNPFASERTIAGKIATYMSKSVLKI